MDRENRKRTREEEEAEEGMKEGLRQGKKTGFFESDYYENKEKDCEFSDEIGVFEFPWLKEGVKIFNGEEYLEREDAFAPSCSYFDEFPPTSTPNFDQHFEQNLCVYPNPDQNLDDEKKFDEKLWPFDDLDSVDCIWSSMVDQPLDVGLNKV